MPQCKTMEPEAKRDFREQLKNARENAFRDAEAFDGIIHVIERLGCLQFKQVKGLYDYWDAINALVKSSDLAYTIPRLWREFHTPLPELYKIVREGRNDALHQGAFARHLTDHAIELALIMEDALRMEETDAMVSDFMVRNPVCAELWQPVSYIRQQMLINSFSFLPAKNNEGQWCLISDVNLANYLNAYSGNKRKRRLAMPLRDSDILSTANVAKCHVELVPHTMQVKEALHRLNDRPVLVHRAGAENEIVGILTAFDLL